MGLTPAQCAAFAGVLPVLALAYVVERRALARQGGVVDRIEGSVTTAFMLFMSGLGIVNALIGIDGGLKWAPAAGEWFLLALLLASLIGLPLGKAKADVDARAD